VSKMSKATQSRLESLIEAAVSTCTGVIIAVSCTQFLQPVFHYTISIHSNLQLTIVLTTLSVLRSFFWRRFFNAKVHLIIHKYLFK